MIPASPVIKGVDEIVIAKNQPPYLPLPAIRNVDGRVITRWRMTWKERWRTLWTGDVYLEILAYGPVQPTRLSVVPPEVDQQL